MTDTVTLSSKGQLVIPKALRDAGAMTPGTVLSIRYVDGEYRLRPLAERAATSLDQVAGSLARPGHPPLSEADTHQAILARRKAGNAPR